jgi:glycosyltransferase involved in cell wall biosynthesis
VARRPYRVVGPGRRRAGRPHAYYLAIGFPPAAKSCAYRMRETANQLYAHGWDVTVITIRQESWEREFGLDHTLSLGVHPGVRIVELPLAREDLETDIRRYPPERALDPAQWARDKLARDLEFFPEPVFGSWRPVLEEALLWLHGRDPADLLVTTCVPYVNLAATLRLWDEHKVPYAVDFRDGWSIDVIGGREAFAPDSPAGRWEARALQHAMAVWCVNEPIAEHYRARYPELAGKVFVVRNGFDADSVPASTRTPDPAALRFGYIGTLTFRPEMFTAVLDAWRLARAAEPLLAGATFDVRGHVGVGLAHADNSYVEMLRAAEPDGVRFGGPVAKAEVGATYAEWDVLVFMVIGGRYMTSGKVYELLASGMPVLSAHEVDHDASTVLDGSPMWIPAVGFDASRLAESFVRAARLAVQATASDRAEARALGAKYERGALMAEAVRHLTDLSHGVGRIPHAATGADSSPAAPRVAMPRAAVDQPGDLVAPEDTATGDNVAAPSEGTPA